MHFKKIALTAAVLAGALAAGAGIYGLTSRGADRGTVSSPVTAPVVPVSAAEDVSHRAIYTFKMVSVESGAGISGIDGQMFYQQQDGCDAYTTQHRFTAEYQYPERPPMRNTSQYTSWEAKDGGVFHFSSDRQENGELVEQLRGSIAVKADGTSVAEYSRPPALTYVLPQGYMLPMAHTHALVAKARAGESFFQATVFDGTDGDGPSDINAFIGAKLTADEIANIAAKNPEKIDRSILSDDAWHVRLAVFPLKDGDTMLPSYEMQLVQHANGVVSHVVVDYRVFKVEQVLEALEKLPDDGCAGKGKG